MIKIGYKCPKCEGKVLLPEFSKETKQKSVKLSKNLVA
jgi:hypothetical protein